MKGMKMMWAAAGLLGILLGSALQASADEATKPGVLVGAQSTTVAIVEAVDMETREVLLRRDDGELVQFVAGDEVRNLAQLEVGDRVSVETTVGLLLMLAPSTGAEPERADLLEVWRAELGQKPGVVVKHTVVATGNVTAIDLESRSVTIQGAERTLTLPVSEDIDLDAIKVGDEVNALYQEAVAIRVEPAPAAQ
jgi:Cu/Ag efflux protein CusF